MSKVLRYGCMVNNINNVIITAVENDNGGLTAENQRFSQKAPKIPPKKQRFFLKTSKILPKKIKMFCTYLPPQIGYNQIPNDVERNFFPAKNLFSHISHMTINFSHISHNNKFHL